MNCSADELMEMPRACSISIQSDTVERRPALPCTAPACPIARACSDRASVSVDLPASGWLMTANVRRRPASSDTDPTPMTTADPGPDDGSLIGLQVLFGRAHALHRAGTRGAVDGTR